jgi:hypothetical protein
MVLSSRNRSSRFVKLINPALTDCVTCLIRMEKNRDFMENAFENERKQQRCNHYKVEWTIETETE